MATSVQENPEAVARIPELIVGDRNARGIPSAIFVVRRALFPCNYHWQAHPFGSPRRLALQESVDAFMTGAGIQTIEPLVGSLQQLYRYGAG